MGILGCLAGGGGGGGGHISFYGYGPENHIMIYHSRADLHMASKLSVLYPTF